MRDLQAKDIFAFARVVSAIGLKEEIRDIAMKANKLTDLTKEELGFDLIFSVFEKAVTQKTESAFFSFMANIFEMDEAEVAAMDPVDFIDKAMEAADLEKWKAFFERVAQLMQKH